MPKRFRKRAGVLNHEFSVKFARCRPYTFVQSENGVVEKIEPAFPCAFSNFGKVQIILVSRKWNAKAFDALKTLSGIGDVMPRASKYIELFKAYEALVSKPDIELACIRHALSHPETQITRPKTVATLSEMFGSVGIDLAKYRHTSVFWTMFGRLQRETDAALKEELVLAYSGHKKSLGLVRLIPEMEARALGWDC